MSLPANRSTGSAGADIEASGSVLGGGTPLGDACGFGNWSAAHRLVERGAFTRLRDAASLGLLDRVNIPSSKIYTIADVAADAQYRDRRMVTAVADPLIGRLLHPGVVPMVAGLDRDAQIRWPGPRVGQHNGEVYRDLLGYSADRIAALEKDGII